ncbi:hypothetical protein [Streptomyces sp. NPDC093109]|uniref:RICIN domain-containing protein n=1 Tax=Streptomyces sp. NPDC093109 TaxID=3154977 RepID=UPI00344BEF36
MTYVRRILATFVALSFLLLWPAGSASADPGPKTLIVNQAQQRCMSHYSGTPEPVLCGVGTVPRWSFEAVPGGSTTIKTIQSEYFPGYCLDTNGSRLYLHLCNGGGYQHWYVTPFQAPGGTPATGYVGVRLKNVATNICIDNPGKNFGGSKIATNNTCNDGPFQQWNITQAAFDSLTPAPPTPGHWGGGMTWKTLEQRADNVVHVGSDEITNPYRGDTSPSTVLPVLCALRDGRAPAPGVPRGTFNSWFAGMVEVSAPVAGSTLTSLDRANQTCSDAFGTGWQIASFHGGGGWSFWANGTLPSDVRFWTYIQDQVANPWN